MKLVTFNTVVSQPKVGVYLQGLERVVDVDRLMLAANLLEFGSMLNLLAAGPDALAALDERIAGSSESQLTDFSYPACDVRLLSPVPRPTSIRDCLSYERHLINCMRTVAGWKFRPLPAIDRAWERLLGRGFLRPPKVWYDMPIYYKGNPASVVGPGAEIDWPSYSQRLDFELELGIFIGREGKNIPENRAGEYIAGYSIFNDFSARDVQMIEMAGRLGPAKGKDFDTGNVIGPWLVTPDELTDPNNLRMTASVNGELWCESNSGEARYSFMEIIETISREETLYPGDFIAAGTVPGGCGLELDRWIAPGDEVVLSIEYLGQLRNRVVR